MSRKDVFLCCVSPLTLIIWQFVVATSIHANTGTRSKRAATDIMTAQMKKEILDKHNYYRRQEVHSDGVANMQYMYWDDGLAAHAKAWAEKCDFEHGGNRNYNGGTAATTWSTVGQNLGWNSHNSDPLHIVNQWYNEKPYYDFDGHTCSGVCGHYTQVVWGESKYLGCSFVRCQPLTESSTSKSWTNGYYLVCHYGPPGNLQGTRPYIKGSNCTRCDSGIYFCDHGLCRDCYGDGVQGCKCEAQCENCASINQSTCICSCKKGYIGQRCTSVCKNNHENCENGWWPSNCNHDFVSKYCPAMCKTCEAPDGTCFPTTAGLETSLKTGSISVAQSSVLSSGGSQQSTTASVATSSQAKQMTTVASYKNTAGKTTELETSATVSSQAEQLTTVTSSKNTAGNTTQLTTTASTTATLLYNGGTVKTTRVGLITVSAAVRWRATSGLISLTQIGCVFFLFM